MHNVAILSATAAEGGSNTRCLPCRRNTCRMRPSKCQVLGIGIFSNFSLFGVVDSPQRSRSPEGSQALRFSPGENLKLLSGVERPKNLHRPPKELAITSGVRSTYHIL